MASDLAHQSEEAHDENKARYILNGMSRYRIDPSRIETADTPPRARGGQGVIIIGTLTHPGALNILLPKRSEEIYPKYFEKLLCDDSNQLHLEAVEDFLGDVGPYQAVLEAFTRFQSGALKDFMSGELKGMVCEAFKELIFGKKVAVKTLEWPCDDTGSSIKFFKSFVNELSLMASLSHPNIIEFLGFVEDMDKGEAWIVLPWEANGNVREFLESGRYDIPERISLIQDIAKGLEYLHSRNPPICHGDLKSLNILVNSSYRAVITDFGSARIKRCAASEKQEDQGEMLPPVPATDDICAESISPQVKFDPSTLDLTLTGPAFSLRWSAPEVLYSAMPDLHSDMWAMGWICWEIVTGRIPFEELDSTEAIVVHTIYGKLPAIRTDFQLSHVRSLCSLMSECWISQPTGRIDASTLQRKVDMLPSETPSGIASDGQKTRSAGLYIELGRMYELQNDRANAEAHYQSAVDIATKTKNDLVKANGLQCLGRIHGANSNFGEAEDSYKQAQSIYSRMDNSLGIANALGGLGEIYRMQSKHWKAEEAFNGAREAHSCIGNDLGAGNAFFGLGNTYQAQSRSREAEKAFTEAYEIHSRIGNDWGTANALFGLGSTYQAQSRNREAEKAFIEAQEIHSRIGNDLGAASALDGLGQVRRAQAEYPEAEKAFKDALEIHSRIGNHLGAGNALAGLGNAYLVQSKSLEAEKAFTEAHKIQSCIGNHAGIANALDGLGEVYLVQSKNEEAEKAFSEACQIYSRIGDNFGTGNALLGLGKTYRAQSRNLEAKKAFEEAHKIHSRTGNDPGAAQALDGLVQTCGGWLETQQADSTFHGPPTIHSPVDNGHGSNNAFGSFGVDSKDPGKYDETDLSSRQVLASYDCADDGDSSARALLALGKLHHAQHQHVETGQEVNKALAIAISFAHQEGQAATSQLFAEVLQNRSAGTEEMDALIQAEGVYAQIGDHNYRVWTLHRMADILLTQGKHTEAEEYYYFAQAICSSLDCSGGVAAALRRRGWLYIQRGRHAEAEECLTQARLAYVDISNTKGEGETLEGLTVARILLGRLGDAKVTCMEACDTYTRIGKPISDACKYVLALFRVLEENPELMALYESLKAGTSGFS